VNGFLVDTNVLSEFSRKGAPDQRVKSWLKAAAPGSLYVSILTLAEIRRGIELLPPSKRRDQLEQWLDTELLESFDPANVLPRDPRYRGPLGGSFGPSTGERHPTRSH